MQQGHTALHLSEAPDTKCPADTTPDMQRTTKLLESASVGLIAVFVCLLQAKAADLFLRQ